MQRTSLQIDSSACTNITTCEQHCYAGLIPLTISEEMACKGENLDHCVIPVHGSSSAKHLEFVAQLQYCMHVHGAYSDFQTVGLLHACMRIIRVHGRPRDVVRVGTCLGQPASASFRRCMHAICVTALHAAHPSMHTSASSNGVSTSYNRVALATSLAI